MSPSQIEFRHTGHSAELKKHEPAGSELCNEEGQVISVQISRCRKGESSVPAMTAAGSMLVYIVRPSSETESVTIFESGSEMVSESIATLAFAILLRQRCKRCIPLLTLTHYVAYVKLCALLGLAWF